MPFLGHAIMALAALLLLSAGWRVTSMIDRSGLERAAGTIVLAAATATLTALALGQLSLGANRWALLAAALVTAALARWRFPEPEVSLTNDLRNWWTGATPLTRVSVGAGLGAFSFLLINAFTKPRFGFDSSLYHYPEVIKWVHSGRPGSILDLNYDYPINAYPLNMEVLMTWGAGMARSFVPMVLMKVLSFPLFAIAMVLLLRKVTDSIALKAVAITALILQPIMIYSTADFTGDVTAVAWSVIAAAFALDSRGNPRRMGIAFVAAGLALGTKPAAIVPLAIIFSVIGWRNRRAWTEQIRWLAPLGLVGVVLGGIWMARTTIQHGWPFWPQQAAPWGDPSPPVFRGFSKRLIDAPWETLSYDPEYVLAILGGTLILLLAGLLAPLLRPRREVLEASGLLLAALVFWCFTPGTGISDAAPAPFDFGRIGQMVSEVRYLAPAAVIAATAIAMAATAGWRRHVAIIIFSAAALASAAIVVNVGWTRSTFATANTPAGTMTTALIAATAVGALVLWGIGLIGSRGTPPKPLFEKTAESSGRMGPDHLRSIAIAGLAIVALSILGAWAADGLVERWAGTPQDPAGYPDLGMLQMPDGDTAAGAMMRQPAWRRGSETVTFAAHVMMPALAGNDLRHDLYLLPKRARCSAAWRASTRGWLVAAPGIVSAPNFDSYIDGYTGYDCALKGSRIRFLGTPSIFRTDGPWVPKPTAN